MGTKNNPGKYDTLHKIKNDEPFFVVRAQDSSSPYAVLEWIERNFDHMKDEKLREAFDCALAMRKYPNSRAAD